MRVVMSPKPKHDVSWLTTDVGISRPLMSYKERTVHHLIKGSQFDIGLHFFLAWYRWSEIMNSFEFLLL